MALPERGGHRPLLVLVSGGPGSGKSTLARRLADREAIWLPLSSVDAFKRGLAETRGIDLVLALDRDAHATIAGAAVAAFIAAMGYFVRAGMSIITAFSFRRGLAERDLAPYLASARVVNVHCALDPAEAQRRFLERERARPYPVQGPGRVSDQMVHGTFDWTVFGPRALDVPLLRVDTTQGHRSSLVGGFPPSQHSGGKRARLASLVCPRGSRSSGPGDPPPVALPG